MWTRNLNAGAFGLLRKPFDDERPIKYLDEALKHAETGLSEQ